jgi:hypothetical protein
MNPQYESGKEMDSKPITTDHKPKTILLKSPQGHNFYNYCN